MTRRQLTQPSPHSHSSITMATVAAADSSSKHPTDLYVLLLENVFDVALSIENEELRSVAQRSYYAKSTLLALYYGEKNDNWSRTKLTVENVIENRSTLFNQRKQILELAARMAIAKGPIERQITVLIAQTARDFALRRIETWEQCLQKVVKQHDASGEPSRTSNFRPPQLMMPSSIIYPSNQLPMFFPPLFPPLLPPVPPVQINSSLSPQPLMAAEAVQPPAAVQHPTNHLESSDSDENSVHGDTAGNESTTMEEPPVVELVKRKRHRNPSPTTRTTRSQTRYFDPTPKKKLPAAAFTPVHNRTPRTPRKKRDRLERTIGRAEEREKKKFAAKQVPVHIWQHNSKNNPSKKVNGVRVEPRPQPLLPPNNASANAVANATENATANVRALGSCIRRGFRATEFLQVILPSAQKNRQNSSFRRV